MGDSRGVGGRGMRVQWRGHAHTPHGNSRKMKERWGRGEGEAGGRHTPPQKTAQTEGHTVVHPGGVALSHTPRHSAAPPASLCLGFRRQVVPSPGSRPAPPPAAPTTPASPAQILQLVAAGAALACAPRRGKPPRSWGIFVQTCARVGLAVCGCVRFHALPAVLRGFIDYACQLWRAARDASVTRG